MKKYPVFIFVLFISTTVFAQLKPKPACGAFVVDVLRGTVNGASANFTIGQIKEKLPCPTSEEEESKTAKCGGGIFYKDNDVYFYTQRNYIEIGPAFKGQFSLPVMKSKRGSLYNRLGGPKLKDADWDAYQTQYGTLVLFYNKASVVNKIVITTYSTDELDLCK